MDSVLAALYGHYLWLLLSIATFLAGWSLGARKPPAEPVRSDEDAHQDALRIAQLAGHQAELKAVQAQHDDCAARLARRDQELAEFKAQTAELQKDYDRLSASNVKLAEERSKLAVEAEATSSALKEAETANSAVAELSKSKKELEEQLSLALHTVNTLKSEMSAFRHGRKNAEAKLLAMEAETTKIKRKYAEAHALLEGERKRVQGFSAEIQKLSVEAASFAEFIDNTRKSAVERPLRTGRQTGSFLAREEAANMLATQTEAAPTPPPGAPPEEAKNVPG